MSTLNKISDIFNNVKRSLREKNCSNRLHNIKRDILCLQSQLLVFGKENNGQYIRSLAMEGYLALISAKTLPISFEEKRNILSLAFNKIKPYALHEECLFICLRIQNLFCYYLMKLDETNSAREILEDMEVLYDKINKSKPEMYLDAEDLFTIVPIEKIKRLNPKKIDELITNNVQMLAFLYNKLNLPQKYALYNHTALRRQLEMKNGTPQEWALRTARLGNFFTNLNQIGNARHHLCAAYQILRTCHDNCKLVPEEFVSQKADYEMHFLELSHHWVKYGLTLFKLSRKTILVRYFSEPNSRADLWKTLDVLNKGLEQSVNIEEENLKDFGAQKNGEGDFSSEEVFTFPSLDLDDMESRVPLDISTVSDARKLFTFTHKWLMRAKDYYDFEHHSAQYISCSLQQAELYEHLAFFEKSIDNQYSLQKRRADALESLISLLKTCDSSVMSVQIDVIRELSQVQLELMALNLQKLWKEESDTNIISMDSDADSIINSLNSKSNKTLTEKTLHTTSKNMFLRKMEAVSSINSKLFRLSRQLLPVTPSELSFECVTLKH